MLTADPNSGVFASLAGVGATGAERVLAVRGPIHLLPGPLDSGGGTSRGFGVESFSSSLPCSSLTRPSAPWESLSGNDDCSRASSMLPSSSCRSLNRQTRHWTDGTPTHHDRILGTHSCPSIESPLGPQELARDHAAFCQSPDVIYFPSEIQYIILKGSRDV